MSYGKEPTEEQLKDYQKRLAVVKAKQLKRKQESGCDEYMLNKRNSFGKVFETVQYTSIEDSEEQQDAN